MSLLSEQDLINAGLSTEETVEPVEPVEPEEQGIFSNIGLKTAIVNNPTLLPALWRSGIFISKRIS